MTGDFSLKWVGTAEKEYTAFTSFHELNYAKDTFQALDIIKRSKGFT